MRTFLPASENDCAFDSRLEITCPSANHARGPESVGRAAAFETNFNHHVVVVAKPGFVGNRRQRRQQAADIDQRHILPCNSASRRLASEMSEISRRAA